MTTEEHLQNEMSALKFRLLQLEGALAEAKRAQGRAELDAKLATVRVENRVREALEGAPTSELWGPSGLIAATMRCIHALQNSEMPNAKVCREVCEDGADTQSP